MKFNKSHIGRLIIGNNLASQLYSFTTKGYAGRIVNVHEDGRIDVESNNKKNISGEPSFTRLVPEAFDLLEPDFMYDPGSCPVGVCVSANSSGMVVLEDTKEKMFLGCDYGLDNGISYYSPKHITEEKLEETLNNSNKDMNIFDKIKMLALKEPNKTLVKHGVLTINGELTNDGKKLFGDFLESKFKEEFSNSIYEALKDEEVTE